MPALIRVGVLVLSCLLGMPAISDSPQSLPVALPPTEDLSALTDLDGVSVRPFSDATTRVWVLVFVSVECPICRRYAPEIQRLANRYAPDGVAFSLVQSPNDATVEKTRRHLRDFGYRTPLIRDPKQCLARWAGVTVTPECAVYLKGVGLLYRGRIDDRHVDFGKARVAPRERDLAGVLEALTRGELPKARTTPAVGCSLDR